MGQNAKLMLDFEGGSFKMLDCLFIGSATKDTLLMVEAPPASDQRIAASAVVHACGGWPLWRLPRFRNWEAARD